MHLILITTIVAYKEIVLNVQSHKAITKTKSQKRSKVAVWVSNDVNPQNKSIDRNQQTKINNF